MKRRILNLRTATIAGTVAAAAVFLLIRDAFLPTGHGPAAPGAKLGDAPSRGLSQNVLVPSRGGPDKADPPESDSPIRLVDVTDPCGVTFLHRDGSSGRHFTPETMSAGLATLDYDGDGLIDIYFPNGAALPGTTYDPPPRHALYKNLGDWRFQEVTESAGVACTAFGLGIAIGDYDSDGWPDIYLDNFGPNLLYRNNGDGTFTDTTGLAGVPGSTVGGYLDRKVGAGASFFDMDGDGDLDLYAGTYMELDLSTYVPVMKGKYPFYVPPTAFTPVPSTLYRNDGGGTFSDASGPSGVGAHAGRAMGVTASDYDNDGDTDLFVCNDVCENFLFRNDGHGEFQQIGLLAGVALNPDAGVVGNMAVDAGDYNNDGWLDFYTTNYDRQLPFLLRNLAGGMFTNATLASNAAAGSYNYVKWGCGLVDFDNDGQKDIFLVNGHTDDNVEFVDATASYRCPNLLLRNQGREWFVNVSAVCGLNAIPVHSARGVAFDDLDNDGDIDIVILNSRERPTILRNMLNEQGCKHHWLQIRLRGGPTNREGVGAHVTVVAGGLQQIDEVHSGRGYQSHWGSRLHFGLGAHDRIDRLEVRWIGGGMDTLHNVEIDRLMTITEGLNNEAQAK